MKLIRILILSLFIWSCQEQLEEARKPEVKSTPKVTPYQPISEELVSKAVLYEANIRQYSNEGSFNAFAEDLPVLKKICLLYTSPSPRDRQKSRMPSSA